MSVSFVPHIMPANLKYICVRIVVMVYINFVEVGMKKGGTASLSVALPLPPFDVCPILLGCHNPNITFVCTI